MHGGLWLYCRFSSFISIFASLLLICVVFRGITWQRLLRSVLLIEVVKQDEAIEVLQKELDIVEG